MIGNLGIIAMMIGLFVGVLLLGPTSAHAAPFTLAVLGDSVSDTYVFKVSLFDRSWTDLLSQLRAGHIQLYNKAVAGSTSTAMLLQHQPEAVAELVRQGKVQNVCLLIGGNDLGYPLLMPNEKGRAILDSAASQLVANIGRAVDTVRAAGPVAVVMGNVPDLGDTPAFRSWSTAHLDRAAHLTQLTKEVNRRLEAMARERRIPIVDLFNLTRRSRQPIYLGGVEVSANLYTPEGIHPSTIGSGLLGNVILEAFRIGYGRDVGGLLLKGHEILAKAGRVPTASENFDAAPFVLFQKAESPTATDDRSKHKGKQIYSRIVWQLLVPGIAMLGLPTCWFWFRWRRNRK